MIAAAGTISLVTEGETRRDRVLARARAIPEGLVRTYRDLDPAAPRFAGYVLSEGHDVPLHRVVYGDGSLPQGAEQRRRLLEEGVPMRGDRVDMLEAHFPSDP